MQRKVFTFQPRWGNILKVDILWGHSSAGRAPALQAGGHRFDPVCLHWPEGQVCTLKTEYLNSKKKPRIIEINENIAKRPREFERTNLQGQVKKGAR